MKTKTLLLVMLFLHIRARSQTTTNVVPDLDWQKTYSQRSNINNVPTALDVVSNAYTTGFQNISASVVGMITLKYDSLGNNIFAIGYSNGTYDEGTAVQVDASGNVYCSGISYASASNRDYVVIKYSSTGVQQFLVKYNGSGNSIDEAYALKLDAASNVYVVGKSRNSAGNYDIVVIKYNSSGTLIWTKIINNGYDDIGTAMVLSSGGAYVYVTGTSVNSSGNTDIVTYCLTSSSGSSVWNKTAAGTGSSNDYVSAITLSGANVVICGYLYNTDNDYVTIKYSGATGTSLWQKSYGFAAGTDDHATALVKDSASRIAVTGTTKNGTIYEYHTVLYDSTGTQLWVNKESTGLTSIDVNPHVATDTIGNCFYVSGQIQKATSDIYAYQITPSGVSTWKQTIDGADADRDAATNICVNGLGEVFLAAQCHNVASNYDIATIKIGQTPVYYPVDNLNETPIEGSAYIQNAGQLLNESGISVPAATIQYYTQGSSPHFFFNNTQMSFIFSRYDTILATTDSLFKINVNFVKSNVNTKIYAHEQYPVNQSYFISQFPNGVKNITASKYLLIPNIYPYIDLHYSSNNKGMKYYFVVKPGGNPNLITHQFVGPTSTAVNGSGDLMINTTLGSLKLEKAYAYQVQPTSTTTYDILPMSWSGTWVNAGTNIYNFNVGSYNPAYTLVFEVDQGNPIVAAPTSANNTWNTFAGGDNDDEFTDLKLDKHGNIYALQNTKSGTFFTLPTGFVGQPLAGVNGAEIFKFNKYGVRVNQTYFGAASFGLTSSAIAVLSDSSVILTGKSAYSIPSITTPPGAYSSSTGSSFILKYSTDMSTLQWSTRYKGYISDVDVNSNNDIYVLAWAFKASGVNSAYLLSKNNALNMTTISGARASVVSHFDQNGVPNWSSFIPSVSNGSIKVDKKRNNYYVFGQIYDTTDFKHFNKYGTFYQPVMSGNSDGFIHKFTSGDSLKVSTLYGGNNDDMLVEGEIMKNGDVYLVGSSFSSDYSATSYNSGGAYTNLHGKAFTNTRGWVSRFDSIMTRKWATTYGDSTANSGFAAITKDSTNNVYVGGFSYGMPTYNGLAGAYFQTTTSGNTAFLRFDAANHLNWATYMGGSVNMSGAKGMAYFAGDNNLCFAGGAGNSASGYPFANFTSPQAYWQSSNFGAIDAFVGRFSLVGIFVGIKEYQKDKFNAKGSLFVYPNPTNADVTIIINDKINKPYIINVVNILGESVISQPVNQDFELPQTLRLSELKSGMYIINVVSEEMNKTTKIIKE